MARIDEDALSLHLEVALIGAEPALLDGLTDPDRYRRTAAAADVARHLADRLRCFEIRCVESGVQSQEHPSLFPENFRLIAWDGEERCGTAP